MTEAGYRRLRSASEFSQLPFKINLLKDRSVVTEDGEVIGTWGDIDDAILTFSPSGSSEVLISDPFLAPFCRKILDWWENLSGDTS